MVSIYRNCNCVKFSHTRTQSYFNEVSSSSAKCQVGLNCCVQWTIEEVTVLLKVTRSCVIFMNLVNIETKS